jgi:hypothetical protein
MSNKKSKQVKTQPSIMKSKPSKKQKYLAKWKKRTETLAELEKRRKVKKIGIVYVHSTDDAPFSFMVERIGVDSPDPVK